MAWALDLELVRGAKTNMDEDDEVIKNVLQVPHEIKTIQEALDTSVDGDTIAIAPGKYYESLQVRTDVILRSDVPPFLSADADRDVHIVGVHGSSVRIQAVERKDAHGHRHHKALRDSKYLFRSLI